jgi:undecaprenyl-diphosphatase
MEPVLPPGPPSALTPWRAAAVLIPALGVFAVLAAALQTGASAALDLAVSQWMERHAQPALTHALLLVTAWHQTAGLLAMSLGLALWQWRQRRLAWLPLLVAAVPGGMLLNVLLKFSFHRARPQFADPLVQLTTFSFPSGHALGTTVFYGFLAAYLWPRMRTHAGRAALVSGAALMVFLVALSRVYLGAHYLTDVLAGTAEGVAWLTICMTVNAHWMRRRAGRAASASS